MATLVLLLLAVITSWGGANAAQEVCVEGFVMDTFCIKRGTLLDNPSVKTLENPEKHSVHCLVDVFQCYDSGFNILQLNPSGSPSYANNFRLDDVGNKKVLEVARANGICSTCGSGGTISRGLRGTFFGTITQEATDSQPATLAVKNMTVSPKMLDPNSMSDGCPRSANKPNTTLSTEASSSVTPTITHSNKPNTTLSTEAASSETPSIVPSSIEICVEGFVMDTFCIKRGTLLDNSRVKTLENPEKHSVHCLVDVRVCYNSGFNILRPNPSGSPSYANAFRLDDVGNQKVLEVARANGICSTCGRGGTIRRGLRGTFFGTIIQEATDSQPATLAVKNMTVSPKTLDPNSMSDGCPRQANKPNVTLEISTEVVGLETPTIPHGATALQRSVKMTICGIVTAVLLAQILNFL